jgi:hypothetical protein
MTPVNNDAIQKSSSFISYGLGEKPLRQLQVIF